MEKNKIQLKVVEALQDDAYKGIARIDSEVMREIGVRVGDSILIKGNKETVGGGKPWVVVDCSSSS